MHYLGEPESLQRALQARYSRANSPGDELVAFRIPIGQTTESGEIRNTEDSLGIRLVGHRRLSFHATFVAGLRDGSIAAKIGQLRPGDEIVQVNDICLLNMLHLNAKLEIAKQLSKIRQQAALRKCPPIRTQTGTMCITKPDNEFGADESLVLVVRRNPANPSLMAMPSVLDPTHLILPSASITSTQLGPSAAHTQEHAPLPKPIRLPVATSDLLDRKADSELTEVHVFHRLPYLILVTGFEPLIW
ncbi:unnamed protein product [Protopolystoma xenopodis]|uniref:PDZ domain-containing protein n=1 Tax=Protopolystoma xenopodis TaxID=117903 RepID=A0A448WRC0_9PLAT|nr:unnamed protein product [Protopolystoma xenopodis]